MTPERWEQVKRIYDSALRIEAGRRAAYLDQACAGDAALRREVESLLAYEVPAEGFIEAPALALAAGLLAREPARSAVGQRIGHYRALSLLGAGGMGEVYLAEDGRLGRKVALKLLPARFTQDAERVRRFAQEARAASALNHPNIITIHEIGEASTENGATHYIVTEYVEGKTLRQRMASAPLGRIEASEAIDFALQIAAALSAAHRLGIMHRDIKPENVMVRRDGIVKVLDFGLAKLTESASPVINSQASTRGRNSTEAGVVMGTPRYMSPEQARGEKVDARTDVFSLGVMLYEMVASRSPFAGTTPNEIIAAILRDEPPPLGPEAPPDLERILGKALCKNREERYQNAGDLLTELKQMQRDLEFASGEKKRSGQAKTEGGTPNKRRLVAIVALAALVIAATVAWLYQKRPPVLTDKDTILLADFENKTGEEIFDAMLKQGLAIQLQQSPFLNLFPEAQMRHELKLMRRPPGERVTAEIAREICERQNLKALIAGSIAPLGSHYVITLEAANGQSGEPLANEQVQAESKEQVLEALSRAATRLRERLGESLSSIQRYDRSLQEGTTASPEAFKAYSQAIELAVSGRLMEAIPFYQRAVEIDPDFAHAYSHLAIMYGLTSQPGRAAEYAKKAYDLQDRAGEFEKFRITHHYHWFATGNLNKRIETLLLQRRTYPREYTGPNDLASAYIQVGQFDQAIAEGRESIRLNPNFTGPYRNLAWALISLNRFTEAKDTLAQALQRKIRSPHVHAHFYQIAFTGGDTAGMQEQIDWARGKPEEYMAWDWQTQAAAFVGQWRKAQDFSRRAIDLAARDDTKEVAARYATEQALRGAMIGDCRRAGADATQGLKLGRGRASLPHAALVRALCHETNQAKPLVDELIKRYPEDTVIHSVWLPAIRAAMELQRGNAAQALDQLQAASRYETAAEFWPQYLRGQAYLMLKRGAEATTEFQKILEHRGYAPLSPLYPLASLGLARAALMNGDPAKARQAYGVFLASWKDADADLPILMEARKDFGKLQ
jgi:eukaryotic-like serine/threonine-protein kinase